MTPSGSPATSPLDSETHFFVVSHPVGMATDTASTGTRGTDAGRDTLDRICDAAVVCIGRFGLAKTTLDDVARESGMSRATLYRAVPGGRDALIAAVLDRETDRFFDVIGAALDGVEGLEEQLVVALGTSIRLLRDHDALKAIAALEPQTLLPQFAFSGVESLTERVAAFAAPYLDGHLRPGTELDFAEFLVRVVLSYTLHPSDRVDPDDADSVRRLVRLHILPGIVGQPQGASA